MNLDIFDRRRAERFAQLLDETNGGLRRHTRDEADGRLAELVAIGHTLTAVRPAAQVDIEFRTGLRAMLVATAERDGIGDSAGIETAHGVHAAAGQPRRAVLGKLVGRRVRARSAIVLGVAAGALAVSGISAASDSAVPGDALYGVKRSTERAQLAMAGSDVTRGQLSLGFARTRLAEAIALDGDNPAFGAVLDDMDNDTRQGVRLLHTSAVARQDSAPLDAVETFVVGQRRLITPVLDELSSENRTRALLSMNLFDEIDHRADGLRTSLGCGTEGASAGESPGSDSLGPKPKGCWVGSHNTGPAGQQGGTGTADGSGVTTGHAPAKVKPTSSGSAPAPGATGPGATGADTTGPGATGPGAGSTAPDASSSGAPVSAGETSAAPDDGSTISQISPLTSPSPAAPAPDVPADDAPAKDGLLDSIFGIFGD